MKKHVYLIMAYHQFELLKKIIRLLDYPYHDIFIHIDATAKNFCPDDFEGITNHSNLYFTDRTNITWGGWSQINCELLLLKKAMQTGEYNYYHLLSGQDLPLHPADKIYNFFAKNQGKEFVHYSTDAMGEVAKKRVATYWLFQDRVGRSRGFLSFLQTVLVRLQGICGVDRTRNIERPIAMGANWFSITGDLAKFVLENEVWINKHFRYTRCADEMFLQMLVESTPFYDKLFLKNSQGNYLSCMRYIDWNRGRPHTFTLADYDELLNSEYMFARKFDWDEDPQICLSLERNLLRDF